MIIKDKFVYETIHWVIEDGENVYYVYRSLSKEDNSEEWGLSDENEKIDENSELANKLKQVCKFPQHLN